MHNNLTKKEIRKKVLNERSSLKIEEVSALSKAICERIICTSQYKTCKKIAIYYPIRNEVDVIKLWEDAILSGKMIYLPRIEDGRMSFYRVTNMNELKPGAFDIPEPKGTDELICDSETLIIMPGSVFSEKRDRIGYGGGFYDTYLSTNPDCSKLAVCYDFQIVESLPAEEFDIKPDIIISENRIIN